MSNVNPCNGNEYCNMSNVNPFSNMMLRSKKETIIDFFDCLKQDEFFVKKHGIPEIFIGGSVRFGYSNGDSDLDVFCFIPNHVRIFIDFLFPDFKVTNGTYYPSTKSISLKNTTHNIHLNIIGDLTIFAHLKHEHDLVENFLNEKPLLIETMKFLKKGNYMRGAVIYRMILYLMKHKKPPIKIVTSI